VFVKLDPPSIDMKPSPAYCEKSQPATRLACAETALAARNERASVISETWHRVFMFFVL
jgi:hypothetical protein